MEAAQAMLPDRYELAKTRLFTDDEPDYYMGYGNLGTRASTFWGARQEVYLIATDRETGILSFIFIDILSNTLIALPTRGIADPNCEKAVFTTSSRGEVFLEMAEKGTERKFALKGSLKRGKIRKLDQRLWVMGNTSIGHSRRLAEGEDHPFAVIFDPAEVAEALDIPPEDMHITENTLFPGLAEPDPLKVICFPYAQHYIADSPGCFTSVKDRDDLVRQYNELAKTEKWETFSAKTIVRQILVGVGITLVIAVLLSLIL
jgi:hypothetical protein